MWQYRYRGKHGATSSAAVEQRIYCGRTTCQLTCGFAIRQKCESVVVCARYKQRPSLLANLGSCVYSSVYARKVQHYYSALFLKIPAANCSRDAVPHANSYRNSISTVFYCPNRPCQWPCSCRRRRAASCRPCPLSCTQGGRGRWSRWQHEGGSCSGAWSAQRHCRAGGAGQ